MGQARDIPDLVGRYEVVADIASSERVDVFEVRDGATLEHQALKLLKDPRRRKSFDREYGILNRLNHPSIVRVHRYGASKKTLWYTMELWAGESVGSYIRSKGKPGSEGRMAEMMRVGALVARALDHLHERGVVLRDLSAASVVVQPDGRVKLVDFGSAWMGEVGKPIPPTKRFIGAFGYAAPEQVRNGRVDHRADIYALGVLLFRMATGKLPVKGRTAEEVLELQKAPPDPKMVLRTMSQRLAAAIHQCLAYNPNNRPDSARRVAEALEGMSRSVVQPRLSLALHREEATLRHVERWSIRTGAQPVTLVTAERSEELTEVLEMVIEDTQARGWVVHGARIEDAGDRAPLQAAMMAARDLGAEERLMVVFRVCSPVAPLTVKMLAGVARALSDLDGRARLAVGLDPPELEDGAVLPSALEAFERVEIGPLSSAETSFAVGRMLGRRAPSGALASRIYKVTSGQPGAIREVVDELVAGGGVEVDGNAALWGRYPMRVPVPRSVEDDVSTMTAGLGAQEKVVLNALALVDDTDISALRANLNAGDGLDRTLASLADRGLVEVDQAADQVRFPKRVLPELLRQWLPRATRAGLERIFVKDPGALPLSKFRVKAHLRGGMHDQAIDDGVELAKAWIDQGRFQLAADLLGEVYDAVRERPFDDRMAQLLLLYAESGASSMSQTTQGAVHALAKVKQVELEPSLQVQLWIAEARLQRSIGHYANYRKRIESALNLALGLYDAEIAAELYVEQGRGELWSGNMRGARESFAQAGELIREGPLFARIQVGKARCSYELGDLETAQRLAVEAVEQAGEDRRVQSDALRVWSDCLRRQGRYSEAIDELRKAALVMRVLTDPQPFQELLLALGWLEADLYRLGEAQDCVDELSATIRRGESLRIRLEYELLSSWIDVLSGRGDRADHALQGVVRRAEGAGLKVLAARATIAMIEAQHNGGRVVQDLATWCESRRLEFLADKMIWPWAETCLLKARYSNPPVDPDECMGPILEQLAGQDVFGLRLDSLVQKLRYSLASNQGEQAEAAAEQASEALRGQLKRLRRAERGAFRIHPWTRSLSAAPQRAK